ncbi:hypothetical protein CsSME_00042953 [Camellia sinensis var. sinensis]
MRGRDGGRDADGGRGDGGGWRPVLRKHGGSSQWYKGVEQGIHTIFVDEIPESMDPKGLYGLFSNFGVVRDVFIPNKRRQMTRSRFGFVRYDCPVAVQMAVQKAHGLWCDNRALKVKVADFGKEQLTNQRPRVAWNEKRTEVSRSVAPALAQGGKSYAQAVSGKRMLPNTSLTINVAEAGNGWLYTSVIVRLKPLRNVVEFKQELHNRRLGDIQVRDGGGRDIVISFASVEIMKEKLKSMKDWIHEWCESIKEWEKGMVIEQERVTWLACYGVPMNLWNSITFKRIGELWGVIVGIDDDTVSMQSLHCGKVRIATKCMESINTTIILNCKGVSYPVKVCEEQVVISKVVYQQCQCCILRSNGDNQASEVESKQEEGGSDVVGQAGGEVDKDVDMEATDSAASHDEHKGMAVHDRWLCTSVVHESDMNLGMTKSGGAWVKRTAAAGVLSPMHFQNKGNSNDGDQIITPGFMRSISGSEINRPGLNIEVVLNKAHTMQGGTVTGQRFSELSELEAQPSNEQLEQQKRGDGAQISLVGRNQDSAVGISATTAPTRKMPKKVKGKGIARSFGSKKCPLQIGGKPSPNLRKGAIFRSAVAAISLSMASKSGSGQRLLNEAEATLQISKVLGLNCEGNEDEVMSKLLEMEAQDKAMMRRRGEGAV